MSDEVYERYERLYIYYNYGYVGIGKTNPLYNLDVNGNINCSGLYINNNNFVSLVDNTIVETSNYLFNYANFNFSNIRNQSTFAYNSTIIDFYSHISSNSFIVNSSNYMDTHICVYHKKIFDSELLIQADFPYTIDGFGSDHYTSRLSITSEEIVEHEYSLEHEQVFIGYAAGGGTRSTTLSPINHKTAILGNIITIKVEIRLLDSDDNLTTNSCLFVITEKKPSSKLILEKYITPNDVIDITSNLYINPTQLNFILKNYQTNDYGKWLSNINTNTINYNLGNVGIGVSETSYKLDVNGEINCSNIYINNNNILSIIDNNINNSSNNLINYTNLNFNNILIIFI